jgi:hypothetical protein
MTQFVIPILLDKLGWATYLLFGALNIVAFPLVWLTYPEVAVKSLEEVSLLFTSDSVFVNQNMSEYQRRMDQAHGNVAVAVRRLLDEVDGNFSPDPSMENANRGGIDKLEKHGS